MNCPWLLLLSQKGNFFRNKKGKIHLFGYFFFFLDYQANDLPANKAK
jgi:hypothetical protein